MGSSLELVLTHKSVDATLKTYSLTHTCSSVSIIINNNTSLVRHVAAGNMFLHIVCCTNKDNEISNIVVSKA